MFSDRYHNVIVMYVVYSHLHVIGTGVSLHASSRRGPCTAVCDQSRICRFVASFDGRVVMQVSQKATQPLLQHSACTQLPCVTTDTQYSIAHWAYLLWTTAKDSKGLELASEQSHSEPPDHRSRQNCNLSFRLDQCWGFIALPVCIIEFPASTYLCTVHVHNTLLVRVHVCAQHGTHGCIALVHPFRLCYCCSLMVRVRAKRHRYLVVPNALCFESQPAVVQSS